MKKRLDKAKLVVMVESKGIGHKIKTVSVYDNRTKKFWTEDQIHERGIEDFLDVRDLKETLNWNLNGDETQYRFRWTVTTKEKSTGIAHIFD